jgi:threonine dehydrogenase-like Zn-dependent dehydrogenase
MEIAEGGSLALLASVGPMGLGAIDYAIHAPRKAARVVVTDIDDERLNRAKSLLTVEDAKKNGVELVYVNTRNLPDPVAHLKELNGGKLFDDVFVFAPVKQVIEMGNALMGTDGCMNFFAGPTDTSFSALFNFYNVHYEGHHIVGTSGGNTSDMLESLDLMAKGILNPVFMITHVGGLDAVAETTIDLDKIPGGKKLIYTNKKLPLTAIADYENKGKANTDGLGQLYTGLAEICKRNRDLWSKEAEDYLLANAPDI